MYWALPFSCRDGKVWDLKCYFSQLNFIFIKCAMCVLRQPQTGENNASNCLTPACLVWMYSFFSPDLSQLSHTGGPWARSHWSLQALVHLIPLLTLQTRLINLSLLNMQKRWYLFHRTKGKGVLREETMMTKILKFSCPKMRTRHPFTHCCNKKRDCCSHV